jgi:hypothetical protein
MTSSKIHKILANTKGAISTFLLLIFFLLSLLLLFALFFTLQPLIAKPAGQLEAARPAVEFSSTLLIVGLVAVVIILLVLTFMWKRSARA